MTQRPDPRKHGSFSVPRLNGNMKRRITSYQHTGTDFRLGYHRPFSAIYHGTKIIRYSIATIEANAGDAP